MLPISILNLHERFSLKNYLAVFESLPSFDPSKPIKRWNGLNQPFPYPFYSRKKGKILTYTGEYHEGYNIPHDTKYPKYKPEPTLAYVEDGRKEPLNAEMLSTFDQALELKEEIGLQGQIIRSTFARYSIFWGTEGRRLWTINSLSFGLLLKRKYAYGVGRSGHWEFDKVLGEKVQPIWKPDKIKKISSGTYNKNVIPVPCRLLQDNERIHRTPFGDFVKEVEIEKEHPTEDVIQKQLKDIKSTVDNIEKYVLETHDKMFGK